MANLSPACIGTVTKGKFAPEDVELFKKAFYVHEGKRVSVSVKRYRENRSLPQNNYYFGVVVAMIGAAIGEADIEAVHEMLKTEHNYYIKPLGKKEIRVPLSTADLDTAAFEAYCGRVRQWAAEFLNLYIPLPNEVAH